MQELKLSCVVYGLEASFEEAMLINDLTRQLNLPFYCINASGKNAFMFSDLASESFEF